MKLNTLSLTIAVTLAALVLSRASALAQCEKLLKDGVWRQLNVTSQAAENEALYNRLQTEVQSSHTGSHQSGGGGGIGWGGFSLSGSGESTSTELSSILQKYDASSARSMSASDAYVLERKFADKDLIQGFLDCRKQGGIDLSLVGATQPKNGEYFQVEADWVPRNAETQESHKTTIKAVSVLNAELCPPLAFKVGETINAYEGAFQKLRRTSPLDVVISLILDGREPLHLILPAIQGDEQTSKKLFGKGSNGLYIYTGQRLKPVTDWDHKRMIKVSETLGEPVPIDNEVLGLPANAKVLALSWEPIQHPEELKAFDVIQVVTNEAGKPALRANVKPNNPNAAVRIQIYSVYTR